MAYPTPVIAGDQVTATDFNDYTLSKTVTLGETIAAGEAVYLKSSDGKVYKTDADTLESILNFIGFAAEAGVLNETKRVVLAGRMVTGLSGLTAGTIYYLSNTAGALSSSEGTYPLAVGVAVSTTVLASFSNGRKQIDLETQQNLGNGTSGEAIAVGNALYVKASDGKLWLADGDADESTYSFVGIAQSASAGADTTVYFAKPGGIAKGLSGLTAGSYYFISATAGALSTTPHATRLARVAQALTTTTVRVIEPYFIRAGTATLSSVTTSVQTTGFYPSKVWVAADNDATVNTGASIAGFGGGIREFKSGVANSGGITIGNESWSCRDFNTGTINGAGSVTTKTQTGFTLDQGTWNGGNTNIRWWAESC
jgi:hypothetical protein